MVIDTATGSIVNLGSITGITKGHILSGMSWSKQENKMYISSRIDFAIKTDTGSLYTINMETCALTLIGRTHGSPQPVDIAFNKKGILYSIDTQTNELNNINIQTGAATRIGSLIENIAYNAGMCFHPETDSLFLTVLNSNSEVGQLLGCNTKTGETTIVGYLNGGEFIDIDGFVIIPDPKTNINNQSELPFGFSLNQNYPNPFNPGTIINFTIPKTSHVKLKIYNSQGKELNTLVNESKYAGNYDISYNGEHLPSGIYFYRLEAGEFSDMKKMILVK